LPKRVARTARCSASGTRGSCGCCRAQRVSAGKDNRRNFGGGPQVVASFSPCASSAGGRKFLARSGFVATGFDSSWLPCSQLHSYHENRRSCRFWLFAAILREPLGRSRDRVASGKRPQTALPLDRSGPYSCAGLRRVPGLAPPAGWRECAPRPAGRARWPAPSRLAPLPTADCAATTRSEPHPPSA